ncbi:DUF4097 family beta strand repeat-containing protein [Peribacillus kribbensis]|uniref:DUF4097 family beta strand repeat-containing protein n=1 Tax=Peribacillus kribbensis TaxID=356658 RepID=UPI001C65FCC1
MQVPRKLNNSLIVKAASGDITIKDKAASLKSEVQSGDIKLTGIQISGDFELN